MIGFLGKYARRAMVVLALLPSMTCIGHAATPASERYFTTSDGVRLHYHDSGRGQTLVFVPGWTMPADIWRAQLTHFAQTHRVIAFDPRAQGRSQVASGGYTVERRAQDLKELLDQLGPEPVVLIGWSLGVLESLAYVGAYGTERLAAVVLVDNSIGEEPPPVSDPTFVPRLRSQRAKTVEGFVRSMFRRPPPQTYLRELVAAALRVPPEASLALLSYPYPRERWRELVYRIDRPLLYAVSARFAEQARNLKRQRPDTWIEVFASAGHALFVDEAERFNDLLARFLAAELGPVAPGRQARTGAAP